MMNTNYVVALTAAKMRGTRPLLFGVIGQVTKSVRCSTCSYDVVTAPLTLGANVFRHVCEKQVWEVIESSKHGHYVVYAWARTDRTVYWPLTNPASGGDL